MRVLHVIPNGPFLGGTEIYVTMLVASLPPERCRSDVAWVADGPFGGHPDLLARLDERGARSFLATTAGVADIARGYDIVHIHSWGWRDWMQALPRPKVLTLHVSEVLPEAADVDFVVHTSADVRARQRNGGPPSLHVPNAIDVRRFSRAAALEVPLPAEVKAHFERGPVIARVARPARVNSWLFWDAIEIVLEARPRARVLIVNHDYRDRFFHADLRPPLRERVLLLPETGDVAAHVVRAALFLHVNNDGTDDLVLQEAMALGVPVVAAEGAGAQSASEGGLLVPRRDDELARAALRVLDSAELQRELGARGRLCAERRLATLVEKHVELYEILTEAPAPAAGAPPRVHYDGKRFAGVVNYDDGDFDRETRYHYRQKGDVVWGTFEGGGVRAGTLVARVNADDSLDMRWQYVDRAGRLKTGACLTRPEVLGDGRVRLHESWRTDGELPEAGTSVAEEIRAPLDVAPAAAV